jgi:putative transposase
LRPSLAVDIYKVLSIRDGSLFIIIHPVHMIFYFTRGNNLENLVLERMIRMPRTARIKYEGGMYHIMVRSISDIPLFRNNDDKDKYLQIINKYKNIHKFKVYGYCLMSTHGHFIIDSAGADISTIMKSINISYSIYYNKTYDRHGPVFSDRFKSKVITNEKYLLLLSAYIHNNPKDISTYRDKIEKYRHSSLGFYLSIRKDLHGLLDTNFILQHFGNTKAQAQKEYHKFIMRYSERNDSSLSCSEYEFNEDGSEYRSEKSLLIRNYKPEEIVSFISDYTKIPFDIHIKYNHRNLELKSLCVVIMRSLCNFNLKQIGSVLGNITSSNVSQLCERGLKLITEKENYKTIIDDLITACPSS